MLVLTRRQRESVVVGDPAANIDQMLKVTVLEIGVGRMRLGFEVAGCIPVNRMEVWQRIHLGVPRKDARTNHAAHVLH
jgi:carbon storage regulator CsrA